jgi:hypothetical protein
MRHVWVLVSLILAAGCAHRRIPGTDIEENEQTKAIVAVMQAYRSALEHKDAHAIAQLLAPGFHDNGGTANPEDDLDAENVERLLTERFSKVENLSLDMELRQIEVQDGAATATYFYTEHYQIPTLTSRAQTESDLKQMTLVKVRDPWRILSGI